MAVQTPVPNARSYPMPVASIARLFKRNNGRHGLNVRSAPSSLDIAASITDDQIFLHVLNTDCRRSLEVTFTVEGRQTLAGKVLSIAPPNLRAYVSQDQPETFNPKEETVLPGNPLKWRFPAASVSVVEIATKPSAAMG
jgi:alpha-L-arabinofuranosidase